MTEGPERLRRHRRAEVGTADADVDDVGVALVGTDPLGERRHRVEHGVDVGDDVLPVDHQPGIGRQTQRRVEHGAILGDVDVIPGEHRIAPLDDAGGVRPTDQRTEQFVVDRLLREVDAEIAGLDHVPLGTPPGRRRTVRPG